MIYLDNAATTYPKPECVYSALNEANRNMAFNAGRGSYEDARKVSDMIDDTRKKIANFVGLDPETVYFESSATEALNIIINGLDLKEGDNVYVSPFEHNAVVRPLYALKKRKRISIHHLPFDKETWKIDETKMKDMFSLYKPKACFVTHISNVTGYILPVGIIFEQTKRYNCINVMDCSQSFGILNPNIKDADFIVFAGHKSLYASFGIAGFVNTNNTRLEIYKSGGTGSDSLNVMMPEDGHARYESGSQNSVAIYGLNKSTEWLKENDVLNHEKELTDYLIEQLTNIGKVHLYIPDSRSILGIVSISIEGYDSNDVGRILSEEFDISVRTGYHCSPFVHDFIDSKNNNGTVRISLGYFNTKNDVDYLIKAIESF